MVRFWFAGSFSAFFSLLVGVEVDDKAERERGEKMVLEAFFLRIPFPFFPFGALVFELRDRATRGGERKRSQLRRGRATSRTKRGAGEAEPSVGRGRRRSDGRKGKSEAMASSFFPSSFDLFLLSLSLSLLSLLSLFFSSRKKKVKVRRKCLFLQALSVSHIVRSVS